MKILLTILLIVGPESLDIGQTRAVTQEVQATYKEIGVDIKVARIIKIRDRYAKLETVQESRGKFYLYRDFIRRVGYGRKTRTHGILPPMRDSTGVRWIGGFAEAICSSNGFSVSNGIAISKAGTVVAMVHELGHSLGATHITSCGALHPECPNIMHSNAIYLGMRGPLKFMDRSIRDIKRCIGTWG